MRDKEDHLDNLKVFLKVRETNMLAQVSAQTTVELPQQPTVNKPNGDIPMGGGFLRLQQVENNEDDSEDIESDESSDQNQEVQQLVENQWQSEAMQTDRQDSTDPVGDEEDEAVNRLDRICECANKILAKYTSNGMIKYSDSPQFHDLVENWDYRMICILEVYTQNRNEDDFLENLGILGELLHE